MTSETPINLSQSEILIQLSACRKAALELRSCPSEKKNLVLLKISELLKHHQKDLLSANEADLNTVAPETSSAFRDRLTLNENRIQQMVESLLQVAQLKDPVGQETENKILANGLQVKKIRSPLGVILMIFESRPNVVIEAFSLGFKAGNVMILRGGKESIQTTSYLYKIIRKALSDIGLSENCIWGITTPDRSLTSFLLKQKSWIDVVVPRGGDRLIEFVMEHSRIPIIKNDRGLCHIYVHNDADLNMTLEIIENAKTQRPGVCNAMETLLIHSNVAEKFLPVIYERLSHFEVQWFACPETMKIFMKYKKEKNVFAAHEENWNTEYLDFKMNCRVVDSLNSAIDHIEQYGSKHSEAIITASEKEALLFQNEVDAAAVYWNASTRFTDGFALGLGGELGISTQKLHVRGPVGLNELTSQRWIISGHGQIRI